MTNPEGITPLPWQSSGDFVSAGQEIICRVPGHPDNGKNWGADSSYIVTACNAYPAMKAALEEIIKGEGRFSRDPLTHASNTIDDMKDIARTALGIEESGK